MNSFYHVYLVVPLEGNIIEGNIQENIIQEGNIIERTDDLPAFIRMNKSDSVTFRAPKSTENYVFSDTETWIVVYKEEEYGGTDLQLELSNSGYTVAQCLDAYQGIEFIDEEFPQIDRLYGFLAFRDLFLSKNIVEEFKNEFDPILFKKLIEQNIGIDDYILEVETNLGYFTEYLVALILKDGSLNEGPRSVFNHRVLIGEIEITHMIDHIYSIKDIDHEFVIDILLAA